MKWKHLFFLVLVPFALIGCQADEGNQALGHSQDELIEVTFGTNPEDNLQTDEPVEIYVRVTQDGKPVDDADDVAFEIWHEDDEAAESDNQDDQHHESDGQDEDQVHEESDDHDSMYREGTEVIAATHQGDGIYSIEKTFDQEGVHFVMYHVTARSYHAMKAEEIHIQ